MVTTSSVAINRVGSLPQRASKAFVRMHRLFLVAFEHCGGDEQVFRQTIVALARTQRKPQIVHAYHQSDRALSVHGLLRPEPDVQKLARALLNLAQDLAQEQAAEPKQTKDQTNDSKAA